MGHSCFLFWCWQVCKLKNLSLGLGQGVKLMQTSRKSLWVCVRISWRAQFSMAAGIWTIDIHQRSQTSYTITYNGDVSHGLKLGVFGFLPTTCKTNVPTVFVRLAVFYECLSSRSDCGRCRWHIHLTNHGYFDYRKKPEDLQFEPGIKMAQVLGSPAGPWLRFWSCPLFLKECPSKMV